jgi:methylthioribose-1-phosphate isomerase
VYIASQTTLLENSRLEAAMSNLKDEQEHTKRELEQRRAAGVNLQAAIQQMQTAAQAVANASLQWDR